MQPLQPLQLPKPNQRRMRLPKPLLLLPLQPAAKAEPLQPLQPAAKAEPLQPPP
jgi:hypothetical protein